MKDSLLYWESHLSLKAQLVAKILVRNIETILEPLHQVAISVYFQNGVSSNLGGKCLNIIIVWINARFMLHFCVLGLFSNINTCTSTRLEWWHRVQSNHLLWIVRQTTKRIRRNLQNKLINLYPLEVSVYNQFWFFVPGWSNNCNWFCKYASLST